MRHHARRKQRMSEMHWLCKLGIHKWEAGYESDLKMDYKKCQRCGEIWSRWQKYFKVEKVKE